MSITTPGLPIPEIPLVPPDLFKDVTPKLCVNCQHMATNRDKESATYRCFAPENPFTTNLVDGSKIYSIEFCETQRSQASSSVVVPICGAEAKWFKQKEILAPIPLSFHATLSKESLAKLSKRIAPNNSISVEDL